MDKEALQQELKRAADGLLVLSETEAPLEFYFHRKPDEEPFDDNAVAAWAGKAAGAEVKTEELDHFFRNMTAPHPDAGDALHAQADRFKNLVATLKKHLEEVKVYRINAQGIKVYILGRTPEGHYAGYETMIVET